MKYFFILLLFVTSTNFAQNKNGSSFSGNSSSNKDICPTSMQFKSEKEVNDLITGMLDKLGVENRFIVMKCNGVDNCQATLYNGKPYILYNPQFLNSVSRLNFTTSNLPDLQEQDWASLTILAHELGHHVNNHLTNPLPDATPLDLELEADKTAGFIIYLMQGSLSNAQLSYKTLPEKSTYTHPAKDKRLLAVETGWKRAEKLYPRIVTQPDINVYSKVEIDAEFPGGTSSWFKYVQRTIESNIDELQKDGKSGTVVVLFIVDKDGGVSDVHAMPCSESGVAHCLGAESKLAEVAVNAIRNGPNWIPAKLNGKNVNTYRRLPVTFRLEEK